MSEVWETLKKPNGAVRLNAGLCRRPISEVIEPSGEIVDTERDNEKFVGCNNNFEELVDDACALERLTRHMLKVTKTCIKALEAQRRNATGNCARIGKEAAAAVEVLCAYFTPLELSFKENNEQIWRFE